MQKFIAKVYEDGLIVEREVAFYADALADKEAAVREERLRHCACEFDDDGVCISSCKLHGDQKAVLKKDIPAWMVKGIAEYEKVITAVKLDSAAIHELSDRQAEEIAALRSVNEGLTEESISMENSIKCLEKINAALRAKYPNGARGCCCLFDDNEQQAIWCAPHAELRDKADRFDIALRAIIIGYGVVNVINIAQEALKEADHD